MVMDEASMIPDPIWRACDGMLNDADTQTLWLVFGNPGKPGAVHYIILGENSPAPAPAMLACISLHQ
jgi:hypothetical protein